MRQTCRDVRHDNSATQQNLCRTSALSERRAVLNNDDMQQLRYAVNEGGAIAAVMVVRDIKTRQPLHRQVDRKEEWRTQAGEAGQRRRRQRQPQRRCRNPSPPQRLRPLIFRQ